jgi:hypothetical protein
MAEDGVCVLQLAVSRKRIKEQVVIEYDEHLAKDQKDQSLLQHSFHTQCHSEGKISLYDKDKGIESLTVMQC